MSNNMILCNQNLHDAYQLLQKGQLRESIEQYQLACKNTYNQGLKNNIKCTIAILQYHQKKENTDQMLHSVILSQNQDPTNLITIRAIANCVLIDILQGKIVRAFDYFDALLEIMYQETNLYQRKNLVQYISYIFFRVRTFEEIPQFIQSMDLAGLKVQEIFSISLMAFNSEICNFQSQERVQKLCYQLYIKHKRYDLAIFSLRALIKFTKNNLPNKQFYEKQLGKLVMLGYFDESIDYQNFETIQTMQTIVEKLIAFKTKLMEDINKMELKNVLGERQSKKQSGLPDKELIVQWKYTISLMIKQLRKNKDMESESKLKIGEILQKMKSEQNILVIRSMVKNNYFIKYHEKVHNLLKFFNNSFFNLTEILRQSFNMIKQNDFMNFSQEISVKQTKKSRLSLKSQRSRSNIGKSKAKQLYRQIADKQNNPPLGISIVSIASSKLSTNKQQGRRKIFEDNRLLYTSKKVQKMVKMCEHGTFLNKRNFNSQGGQYRFVKITNSFIKWGKDPQKIQTNCQIYPLKDIKSIVYGRLSPNLNESCNKMLSFSKCFSLLLQKRTLDFYCKNYDELEGWVCGLSAVLKKHQNPIVGYTPGKLRWKRMFAILKQNFIEPLKANERSKYYYENAYSLILFAKNGYKLKKVPENK